MDLAITTRNPYTNHTYRNVRKYMVTNAGNSSETVIEIWMPANNDPLPEMAERVGAMPQVEQHIQVRIPVGPAFYITTKESTT